MAKRVGVILSGCGWFDGSDVAEAMLVLFVLERAGAQAVCVAPDVALSVVVDHSNPTRNSRTGSEPPAMRSDGQSLFSRDASPTRNSWTGSELFAMHSDKQS